jgi:hypothetical protein
MPGVRKDGLEKIKLPIIWAGEKKQPQSFLCGCLLFCARRALDARMAAPAAECKPIQQ